MTTTTRTAFEFFAIDTCPDCYDEYPFTEDQRWAVFRSESQRVIEDARAFLAERGVLVHATQRVR